MRYPAVFTPAEEGGYVVTFRDIPEAITQGDSKEEALVMAQDALLTAMEFYFDDKRQVPQPSASRPGDVLVEVPPSTSAKILLLNEMLEQKVGPSELAKRIGTRPQDVQRLINLDHASKIDTLATALQALGKRIDVTLSSI